MVVVEVPLLWRVVVRLGDVDVPLLREVLPLVVEVLPLWRVVPPLRTCAESGLADMMTAITNAAVVYTMRFMALCFLRFNV